MEPQLTLTPELVNELVQLLQDKKVEVRHGTLNVILQFTPTEESQRLFVDTKIIQLLIKNVFVKALTTACLSTLINFSGCEAFHNKLIPTIEPILLELKTWKGLQSELALLYLTNVSRIAEVGEIIVGKQEKQGYFVELLLNIFMQQNNDKNWHIANIFSNLTSLECGRKYFTSSDLILKLVPSLFTNKYQKRMGLLKTIRNCLFEWENPKFIGILLEDKRVFIDTMSKFLLTILYTSKHLIEDKQILEKLLLAYEIQPKQPKFDVSNLGKELEIELLQNTIQIFMKLTNIDLPKLDLNFKKKQFRQIVSEMMQLKLKQQIMDQIEVLSVFIC